MWKKSLSGLEHWLRIDQFEDPLMRNRIKMLYVVTLLACIVTGPIALFHLFSQNYADALVVGVGFVASSGILWLIRRGWVEPVIWLLPLLMYGVVTQQVVVHDRIFDEAMFAYPALIMLGGLLSGRRGVVIFTALNLGTIAVVGLNQVFGATAYFSKQAGEPRVFTILILVGATGGVAYLLISNLLDSLQRQRENEQALTETNAQLKAIQTALEVRVEQRTRGSIVALQQAENARQTLEEQAWLSRGQVQLADVMRGDQDIGQLAENILRQVCTYLEIPVGILFVNEDGLLRQVGGYAIAAKEARVFNLGEGLVGQAALEQRAMLLEDGSGGELKIRTGLGDAPPRQVLIHPICNSDQLVGVIELGVLRALPEKCRRFLELAETSIAVAFQTAQARQRVNELLSQTQSQAAELQMQEEELRAVNEELQAQAESMRIKTNR